MINNELLGNALVYLGYNEFVVRGDTYEGIEWIEQPDNVPSKEDIDNAVTAIQIEQDAKVVARDSALTKLQALGLTEVEIKALVGA
jgi:hypothetical protein